jgi:GrpB-like predicted nucleotidyltransferase (UPF0157 family)/protein associated with RNAse G/E
MLGLAPNLVALTPYTPVWAQMFQSEAERLYAALGAAILDIQHVGSTAIPGIPAKPIIDIGIAVANFEEAAGCIEPLVRLGYTYRGEMGIPRRHYFVKREGEISTFHLHMNEVTSADWRQQIALRDYLRQHPAVAQEYADLKLRLAEQFPTDRVAYTEGKSGFISQVLVKALPDLWPRPGDVITVRVYKQDQTLQRWWSTTVESITDEWLVTLSQPGNLVHDRKGDWQSRAFIRAYYWWGRFYNLLEVYDLAGTLGEIYLHVASPALCKTGVLIYTDYELDVVKLAGQTTLIVDQAEFAEAAVRYGYSAEFQAYCQRVAEEAVQVVDTWSAKGHIASG